MSTDMYYGYVSFPMRVPSEVMLIRFTMDFKHMIGLGVTGQLIRPRGHRYLRQSFGNRIEIPDVFAKFHGFLFQKNKNRVSRATVTPGLPDYLLHAQFCLYSRTGDGRLRTATLRTKSHATGFARKLYYTHDPGRRCVVTVPGG
jgi:hypothetical protein